MMVTIWRENIIRLGILDTHRLYNDISGTVTDTEGRIMLAHEFMLYGIFVARGVGNGYRHDNGGNLKFLNNPGPHRKKRDWFSRKYIRSIDVLTETERDLYGEAYMGTLSNVLGAMMHGWTTTGSKGTDVTGTLHSL